VDEEASHPLGSYAGSFLVDRTQLGDPDARSVVLGSGLQRADIVVVHSDGTVRAYLNECPHAFTTLETFDGRFLDKDDPELLVCSTHGARFRVADGVCVAGPCLGKRLRAIPITLDGDTVRIRPGD